MRKFEGLRGPVDDLAADATLMRLLVLGYALNGVPPRAGEVVIPCDSSGTSQSVLGRGESRIGEEDADEDAIDGSLVKMRRKRRVVRRK